MSAHPFLKWVGGKTALLSEITSRLPVKKVGTYYEPFIGGGAVFFALAAEGRFEKAVIGDASAELMCAYAALSSDVDGVVRALKKHVYEKEYYYDVRAQNPKRLGASARAARFIYLNKACFNGLYRVNKKGVFNVPFGAHKNLLICDEENLRAVAKVLKKTKLAVCDFERAVEPAVRGDFVYFDPPYVPVSETSDFTDYTTGGFGLEEQQRLRDVARRLDDRGVRVLLSNSDTPFVRKLYKGFRFEEVRAPRRVNSNGGKRGKVGELLISGRVSS